MNAPVSRLHVHAVSTQTLLLASDPQVGNRRGSQREISGTTLRGALAALWIRRHGEPDDAFHQLFDGSVAWPTLRPADHVAVPLSVRRCKYRPKPDCDRTAVDVFGTVATDDSTRCPVCGGFLELAKGELINTAGGSSAVLTSRTASALTATETAADEQLFTRLGMPRGTRFSGTSTLPEAPGQESLEWIGQLAGVEIRVGGRRSVNGNVRIEKIGVDNDYVTTSISAGSKVAVRLVTPAIVIDRYGAPSSTPESLLAGLDHRGALRLAASADGRPAGFLRPVQISGWNALAGIPKVTETGLAAGSTLICETSEPLSPEDVARIVGVGVGTRKNEGFGEVRIDSDPWTVPFSSESASGDTSVEEQAKQESEIEWRIRQISDLNERRVHYDWVIDRLRSGAAALRQRPTSTGQELVEEIRDLRSTRSINRSVIEATVATLNARDLTWNHLERLVVRFENTRDTDAEGRP
jgi:CRISPR-associated protein Csx10